MPEKTNFMTIVDELIAEEASIIDELIEEEIKPIIDYREQLEKKIFERAYKEVLDMERKEE